MDPTTTPSDQQLWAQACALVARYGKHYATQFQRSNVRAPITTAVFSLGQLGTKAPEQAIVAALSKHPLLWPGSPDSPETKTHLNQFMSEVRQALEESGPVVLSGLGKGLSIQPSRKVNAQAVERAASQLSDKHKRLLTMIREEPSKAALSARTRLTTDAVQWENTLVFLSYEATTPAMGALMVVTGELIRHGLLDQVFTESDLASVAAVSPQVWLQGLNEDLTDLRIHTARKLGALIDDPQRGPEVLAALSSLKTKAKGGIPQPIEWTDEQIARVRSITTKVVDGWLEAVGQHGPLGDGMGAVIVSHLRDPNWAESLTAADWHVLARIIPDSYDPQKGVNLHGDPVAHAVLHHLMPRTQEIVLAQVSTATLKEPALAQEEPKAFKPFSRMKQHGH